MLGPSRALCIRTLKVEALEPTEPRWQWHPRQLRTVSTWNSISQRQYRKAHTERRKFRLCVALQTRGKFPGSLVCLPPVCGALVCWACLRLWRLVLSSGSVGGPCPLAPPSWALSFGRSVAWSSCRVCSSGPVVWCPPGLLLPFF